MAARDFAKLAENLVGAVAAKSKAPSSLYMKFARKAYDDRSWETLQCLGDNLIAHPAVDYCANRFFRVKVVREAKVNLSSFIKRL